MAKRKTIGNDPLAESAVVPLYPAERSAEIVPMPTAAMASAVHEGASFRLMPAEAPPRPEPIKPAAATEPTMARGWPEVAGKARRMVGGHLEILGGDLGSGNCAIWPGPRDRRIGFVAPNGRRVDIARDLATIHAWGDGAEHRYLSAIGWAWVLGSLGGIAGVIVGGGLRLLEPRRMMVILGLEDGSRLVARSDAVTIAGLRALVGPRASAMG
jgi:hypothetical protein